MTNSYSTTFFGKYVLNALAVLILTITLSSCDLQTSSRFTGHWADSASASFTNCHASILQREDSIYFMHFLEFNKQPFFEAGQGIVDGDSIRYHVEVLHQIPGWSTAGDHVLGLDADGNTLRGYYNDNKGNHGPLVFKLIR